jgi:hypothetical protein
MTSFHKSSKRDSRCMKKRAVKSEKEVAPLTGKRRNQFPPLHPFVHQPVVLLCCFFPRNFLAETDKEFDKFKDQSDKNDKEDNDEVLSWNRNTTAMAPATKAAMPGAAAVSTKTRALSIGVFAQLAPPSGRETNPFQAKAVERQCAAHQHGRCWLQQLELDSSIHGTEGSCIPAIKKGGTGLVFKTPVKESFSDPHDCHWLLKGVWKRFFENNSQKAADWKVSNGHALGKFLTFRISLPCSLREELLQ